MSNSVIKPLTKEELDKIYLAPEAITHYSQEDELKRLLFERELYKRMYEEQQKRINTFAQDFDNIMSTPVHTSHGIKSLREHVQQETFKYKLDQLTKSINFNMFPKITSTLNFNYKIEKDIYFMKNFAM
jgi:hypothetical protein